MKTARDDPTTPALKKRVLEHAEAFAKEPRLDSLVPSRPMEPFKITSRHGDGKCECDVCSLLKIPITTLWFI
jgi:hypothetical protein